MAAKKTPLKRELKKAPKKAIKKPAPKRAVSKKAVKNASTATAEAAPAGAPAGGKKQTKTAFVLSFSPETPAKEVVAAGAAQGIALSEKGVYKTRYLNRSKLKKAPVKTAAKFPSKLAKASRKPGKRGPGDGSGSAFIRQQPVTMKAGEVVAAAKKAGISTTPGLVYSVRGAKKKSGNAPSATTGKRRGQPPSPAAKAAPRAVVTAGGGDRERQLVQLALDVGLARAQELLQGFRAKIDTLY